MSRTRQRALAAVAVLALTGCGGRGGDPAEARPTATLGRFVPRSVELYTARQDLAGFCCLEELAETIYFRPGTAEVLAGDEAEITKWALCLQRPGLEGVTLVLAGADAPEATPGLALRRAVALRDALVMRGLEPDRVVVGTEAAREGVPPAPTTGVRLDLSGARLRSVPPPDPGPPYGVWR